ncbi:MAG TPA: ribosome maturation factor RimP [Calditrichaeota bacterium]|nr:ribosome maturation factor RimP [Calditrichota bacterium]
MDLRQKLEEIALPLCEKLGLYLVEIRIKGTAQNPVYQVFADNEKGITLAECEQLSRAIKDELDMDLSLPSLYRLDVSSPGLDRPLVHDYEFKKNIGQLLKVTFIADGKEQQLEGKLTDFDKEAIEIQTKGKTERIRRDQIKLARVQLRW